MASEPDQPLFFRPHQAGTLFSWWVDGWYWLLSGRLFAETCPWRCERDLAYTSYDKSSKIVTLVERNYFSVGDEVELFTPNGDVYSFVIEEMYNEDMESIEVARHPEEVIKLKLDGNIVEYSMLRKKVK